METSIKLEEVKAKLKAGGYGGLYFPGECACDIDDLAPCGECQHEEDEEFINDCEAGYKHVDPKRPDFWVISANKEPPTQDRFDEVFSNC